jgi:AbiV family abortive infection protein
MEKPLNQYRGLLSALQAAEGMNAAARNARRLAEDAKLLFAAERFPSAASLAILAFEECGKIGILRNLLLADSPKELAEHWRRYRKHTEKNYLALIPDLVGQGAKTLHELRNLFTKETDSYRATYDTVKQLGFYTDCCGLAHWSVPAKVIDANLAALLVSFAEAVTNEKDPVTTLELELWVFHISEGLSRENLLKWCAAMVEAGLKPAEYLEEMRNFTRGFTEAESGMRRV